MNDSLANRALIFSHRGALLEAPENTRCAFEKSLEYGIDGIETDVQLSRDGTAVLWHDRTLEKLGLPDKRIDDYDIDALLELRHSGSAIQNQKCSGLMTLQDFIERYHCRCQLLIEVKNRAWDKHSGRHEEKMRACADLAERLTNPEATKKVFISSFDLDSLAYTYRYTSKWSLIYNSERIKTATDVSVFFSETPFIEGLCVPIDNLNENLSNAIRKSHRTVATYPCASKYDIMKALDIGVDILITDDPKTAMRLRR